MKAEENFRFIAFVARFAAQLACQEIMQVYHLEFSVRKKEDASPITDADTASDAVIRTVLETTSIPVISEEQMYMPATPPELFWCVDPLDGTREFVKRNGQFAVNIALVRKGVPVFGLVASPVKNCCWYTENGQVWKYHFETEKITPCSPESTRRELVMLSGTLDPKGNTLQNRWLKNAEKIAPLQVEKMGSALKFGAISEGKADLYIRFGNTHIWDTAAGHALLLCSGGDLYSLETRKPLTYSAENTLNPHFGAFGAGGKEFFLDALKKKLL